MLRRNSSKKETTKKQMLNKFLEFLNSGIWNIPIATFIEQKSIIFDREHGEPEIYEDVHKEYKDLVDVLVDCFCNDAEIQSDKLVEALNTLEKEKMTAKQRASLEPLAAAQHFNIFVPMMMRKNVELQLQALQMIEFMCGLIPAVLQLEDGETLKDKQILTPEETERYVLISVLRHSKAEFDAQNEEELRRDLEAITRSGEEERRRLEAERDREQALMGKAMETGGPQLLSLTLSKAGDDAGSPEAAAPFPAGSVRPGTSSTKASSTFEAAVATDKRPVSRKASAERPPTGKKKTDEKSKEKESKDAKETKEGSVERPMTAKRRGSNVEKKPPTAAGERKSSVKSAKAAKPPKQAETEEEQEGAMHGPRTKNVNDIHALLHEPNRPNTADVRGRAEYLRQQRDRLLALKMNERQKQMMEVSEHAAHERPRTAKAARGAMRDTEEGLAARRALAAKIRKEVAAE